MLEKNLARTGDDRRDVRAVADLLADTVDVCGRVFRGEDGALLAVEQTGVRRRTATVIAPRDLPAVLYTTTGHPAVLVGPGWAAIGSRVTRVIREPVRHLRVVGTADPAAICQIAAFADEIGAQRVIADRPYARALAAFLPDRVRDSGRGTVWTEWCAALARLLAWPGTAGVVCDDEGLVHVPVHVHAGHFARAIGPVAAWGLPLPVPARTIGEGLAKVVAGAPPFPSSLAPLPRASHREAVEAVRACCRGIALAVTRDDECGEPFETYTIPHDVPTPWRDVKIRVADRVGEGGPDAYDIAIPVLDMVLRGRIAIAAAGAVPVLRGALVRMAREALESGDRIRMAVVVTIGAMLAAREPERRGACAVLHCDTKIRELPVPREILPLLL